MRLATQMAGEKMTVRSAEKLVLKRRSARRVPDLPAEVEEMQNKLQQFFATRVRIQRNQKGRGKIEVEFYSDQELVKLIWKMVNAGEQ
jgi:ParB family chromosome partitioning protein